LTAIVNALPRYVLAPPPAFVNRGKRGRGISASPWTSLCYAGRQVDRPPQQDAPGPHVSGAPLQAHVKVAPPLTSSISERSNCFRVSLFSDNFLLVFFIYDPPTGMAPLGIESAFVGCH